MDKRLEGVSMIKDFDQNITVPLWEYEDVNDYLRQASCIDKLGDIQTPLLCLNALDDPLVSPETLPNPFDVIKNPNIIMITTRKGGHIGWGDGHVNQFSGSSWGEKVALEFLVAIHQTDKNRKKRVSLQQFEGKQKTNNHSVQRTCNDNSIISAKL